MKNLIQIMLKIKDDSEGAAERLERQFSRPSTSTPISSINMLHNHLTLCVELLSHYENVFPPIEGKFEENIISHIPEAQRVNEIFKLTFIIMMSSFEHGARKFVQANKEIYGKPTDKLFLINIMQRSCKLGWISVQQRDSWEFLICLRNSFVHNNSESQLTTSFVLPNGIKWSILKNAKTVAPLLHLPFSMEWALQAYTDWCRSVLCEWIRAFDYSPSWNYHQAYRASSSTNKQIPTWGSSHGISK